MVPTALDGREHRWAGIGSRREGACRSGRSDEAPYRRADRRGLTRQLHIFIYFHLYVRNNYGSYYPYFMDEKTET